MNTAQRCSIVSTLAWLAGSTLVDACSGDSASKPSSDAAASAEDASTNVVQTEPPPRKEQTREVDLLTEDSDQLKRFRDAPEWEVGYWSKNGGWSDQRYEVMLDRVGNFYYNGISSVAVKGIHELKADAGEVRALYDKLLDLGFLRLRDAYEDEATCFVIATDGSTHVMRMTLPDENKPLTYYTGCGIRGPTHDALRAIQDAFATFPAVQNLTGHGEKLCDRAHTLKQDVEDTGDETLTFALSTAEGKAVGMLELAKHTIDLTQFREVTISDCQGKEVARTKNVDLHTCGVSIFPAEEGATLTWPGIDLEVNAALFAIDDVDRDADDKDYAIRLLNIEREIVMRARKSGDRCQNR